MHGAEIPAAPSKRLPLRRPGTVFWRQGQALSTELVSCRSLAGL